MTEKTETAGETAILIFNSDKFGKVRTAGTPENPLFCLVDICKALELTSTKVKCRLSDGVLSKHPIADSLGRKQPATFVNEDGLYDVILDSRKPEAKAFRKWITAEVLPAIRKTGGYMAARQDETPEQLMARALKIAEETIRRQEMTIESKDETIAQKDKLIDELDTKVRRLIPIKGYVANALETDTTYTMTEVAQFLGFSNVGAFASWLVTEGIMIKVNGRWVPTQRYAGQGFFTTRVFRKLSGDNILENRYTVVTEKGRLMLFSVFDEMTSHAPNNEIQTECVFIEEGGEL